MILPLLLAAAGPETAVDAERAFNAAAQAKGQWTAFREFMTDDAIVFTPQPTRAKEALPDKNPPIAVQWWPADSFVSCDGTMAVNTGPWVRPNASGYFTTVWVRQADGHFKWVMDGGDRLETPRPLPEQPRVRRASCATKASNILFEPCPTDMHCDVGRSPDKTVIWDWTVKADGARIFRARLWNGRDYDTVVANVIAASK